MTISGGHTCDTEKSGSERTESTCAACQDEMRRALERYPPVDWTAEFDRQTAFLGRTK